jgi:hypothetical protein
MSKFKTTIPVDVEQVKKLLPPGAHLDGVTFDAGNNSVEVRWQHDGFRTPLDHAVEYPLAKLIAQNLPPDREPEPEQSAETPTGTVGGTVAGGTPAPLPDADVPTASPEVVAARKKRR